MGLDTKLDGLMTTTGIAHSIASFGKDRIRIGFSNSAIFMFYFLAVNG